MQKRRRWLRWISGIVLFLIVVLAVISAAFYVSYSNGSLIRYIQKKTAGNVSFTVDHHTWYDWSPSLELSHIKILTNNKQKPVLELEHAHVVIDIFSSLIHQTLVTRNLVLSGADITLQQNQDGSIVLKGQTFKHRSHHNIAFFARLISLQHYIAIHSIHLHLDQFTQPALKGDFDLALGGSGRKGSMILSSDDLQVGPDHMFEHAWPRLKTHLSVKWQKQTGSWLITFQSLKAQYAKAQLQMHGTLTVPNEWRQSKLDVTAKLSAHDIAQDVPKFIPKKGVSPGLYEWLSHNILKLGKADATLKIKGQINQIPFAKKGQGDFDIHVRAMNGALIPYKGWPKITDVSGDLYFKNQMFKAFAQTGKIYGDKINPVTVTVPDLMPGVPSEITVKGSMHARGKNTKRYVDESPLKETIHLFQFATLKGPYDLAIDLAFPLANPNLQERITGSLLFKNNEIALTSMPLEISKLAGQVNFNKTAINSPSGLKGIFLSEPVSIQIHTNAQNVSKLLFEGTLSAKGIQNWLKVPLAKKLSGSSPFSASVTQSPTYREVIVRTSLKGLQSDLPSPLYKPADTEEPVYLHSNPLPQGGSLMKLTIGSELKGSFLYNKQEQLASASIVAGLPSDPVLPESGINMMIYVPYLSVSPWLSALGGSGSKRVIHWPKIHLTLGFGQLDIFNHALKNFKLTGQSDPQKGWAFQLDSKTMKGSVQVPVDLTKRAIMVRMEKLQIATNKKNKISKDFNLGSLNTWPALNVMVSHFVWNDIDIGRVAFEVFPKVWGLKIPSLNWHNKDIDLMIKAALLQKDHEVQIEGKTNGKNYGQALADIGYPNLLTLTKGKTRFNLDWEGGLLKPNIKTFNGFIDFDLEDGLLSSVNPGISRLLGVFSLQALSRRLSMNFSDLTQKGLAFNSLKGQYSLARGIAKTDKVVMDGPALDLTLRGQINLVQKTMQQEVKVMPHVDSGLAIAATILGGPIVGIATWVGDHLLSNTVLKDKGLEYTLTGPWDNPVFKTKGDAKEGKSK